MPSFCLSYRSSPGAAPGATGKDVSVAFEAVDAGAALSVAFRHAAHRAADLWCDGQMLCRIECPDETGGFWLIS